MNTWKQSIIDAERGQGLVEYALILVLVAVVVIVVLTLLGAQVSNVFCQVIAGMSSNAPAMCETDTVVITKSDYDSGKQEFHLDATSNGDFNPDTILTASPGGVMEAKSDHYHLEYTLTGCPCTVTVTSSEGGSATVTVP